MPDMTPYHQVVEFISWLRSDPPSASNEEVEHHLRILEADLELWAQKLRALKVPSDTAGESTALVEESLQGLDLFRQAIAHVREYMDGRPEEAAEAAISEARSGVEMILRVKGITEDNIERLLDEAELPQG